ncbi:uncharacterized protein CMC5_069800 [Chondromyces crocatus]|uniref:Glycosyltransferase RgtA/B/C/D-like domain-containing protein n=1 Tax=Chondromyces crocatus TaxID=52 RepID=A0A0K1EQ58_CHOCO|nr:uncharacterized protein CMC5_069800 [Chondromyces crocatus]
MVPFSKVVMGAALSLSVVCLLLVLTFGYGRDQGIYAMVARITLDGGMPYRDAFDFKPPGIFLLFMGARALFGAAQWGIRVVEVAGLVAMSLCMVRLAERWWGDRRIGVMAAALTLLVHAQLDFWHTAQPESFGGMLTVFALLLVTPGADDGDRARVSTFRLIGAGVLFGFAGLLKPPLAGGGAVLAVALGWPSLMELPRALRARRVGAAVVGAVRPGAFIALGGVLPIAACVAWFAAQGALEDLHRVLFVFTPHYTALGWKGQSALVLGWYGVSQWLTNYSGPMALGLGCLVALHPERRERAGVALLGGIIAMHLAGVVMQAKFFPYHFGATWPLTGMLAGLGLWKAWTRAARWGWPAAAGLASVLVLFGFARSATKDVAEGALVRAARRAALFAAGARDQAALDALASVADVNAHANRTAASFLSENVAPERSVFVWGFEPVIYDLADRESASRYLYNVPQRAMWGREPAREALMAELSARPPAAIVVERHDVFPMVTGEVLDSRDALRGFPPLAELLDERYRLAATFEDLDVYLEDEAL